MNKLVRSFTDRISEIKGQTAERPQLLETDALARYSFASSYCKGKKVLDVGTGFGLGAAYIAKKGAKSVLGIDYSKEAINQISKHNKLKNVSFKHLDAFSLNEIKEQFDVVMAFEIIEHIAVNKVPEFIMLLYERVAPGGILLLSTPNGYKSQYLLGKLYNPYHVKEYTKEELTGLLEDFFSTIKVMGYELTNKSYIQTNAKITKSLVYDIAYLLGHYKIAREILAFIPKQIKHLITKENTLPTVTEKDYSLLSDPKGCYCYFIVAQKASITKKLPKISVVIANYNGENFLKNCLESLLKTEYKDFEIVICDDGSTDKSLDILNSFSKRDSRIKIFKNKINSGASQTRNNAVAHSSGEIMVFLDNDTLVDKNWLSYITEPFLKDIRIGGVQALLLDMKHKELIQHAGGLLVPQAGWLMPFYQWSNYNAVKNNLTERNIVAVSAALAVRKSVFEKIKGFDEKVAVHTEDLDLSWRIWVSGYKIVLANKSIVYHLSKSVESRAVMNTNYYKIYFHLAKNSFRSFLKIYELNNVFAYLPVAILINLGRGILVALRRNDLSAFVATIKALFWNLINIEDTLNQRKEIQSTRVLSDKYLFDQVFDKGSLLDIYNKNFKQSKLLW